jgi:hypothetical protein
VSIHALEHSRELYKVPRASGAVEGSLQGTQRRSPGRPVRTNEATRNYAPAQGVSTRKLTYLVDGLRGEYERIVHNTYVRAFAPQEGVPGGDENASPYYVLAARRRSPPASEGSEGANVLVLCMGIFQYNNVLVPTVRRVARMRRHLTSIRITYRYRELYVIYRKSAERKPNRVQFRWLDASQQFPCTSSW